MYNTTFGQALSTPHNIFFSGSGYGQSIVIVKGGVINPVILEPKDGKKSERTDKENTDFKKLLPDGSLLSVGV